MTNRLLSIFSAFAFILAASTLSAPADHHETSDKAKPVKNIKAKQAAKMLAKDKDIVVLDVRTADEFSEGHIKGAKNINYFDKDFAEQIGKLDRKKTYLVHCASGGRSGRSLKQFEELGFVKILHMEDGFNAWKKAGEPMEK